MLCLPIFDCGLARQAVLHEVVCVLVVVVVVVMMENDLSKNINKMERQSRAAAYGDSL